MPLPDNIVNRLRQVADRLADIRALYVFGSRARDDARSESDLDVGVLTLQARGQDLQLDLPT